MHIHALKKKKKKDTHGYLITLAFKSRGDMIYVGHNAKLFCEFIYEEWDYGQWTLKILPIFNAHVFTMAFVWKASHGLVATLLQGK